MENQAEPPVTDDTIDFVLNSTGEYSSILVKGTTDESGDAEWRSLDGEVVPGFEGLEGFVVPMEWVRDDDEVRRGWDPEAPWTDDEARSRGARYWPIAAARVRGWIQNPDDPRPECLLLAVPTRLKQTIVRYVWEIDWDSAWRNFGSRWEIPLGRRLVYDPMVGTRLVDEYGKQALAGYASGVREVFYNVTEFAEGRGADGE